MPFTNRVRVAASQYFIRPIRSFEQFVEQVTSVVETAADYGSRLLVFPEYFTTQLVSLLTVDRPINALVRDVADYGEQYAEALGGLARKHGLYIVAGSIPVRGDGERSGLPVVYNDAYVFAPSGDWGVQGKLHMTRFEKEAWDVSPRDQIRIFETDFGRMAVTICYDVEFPEMVRAIANEGVDILCVPSNTDTREGFLRVRYCAHARAIENQMYVIHSPAVGGLPRVPDVAMHYGQASVLTPCDFAFARDGILAQGEFNQEQLIIADLDLNTIQESRSFGTVMPLNDSKHTKELIRGIETVVL